MVVNIFFQSPQQLHVVGVVGVLRPVWAGGAEEVQDVRQCEAQAARHDRLPPGDLSYHHGDARHHPTGPVAFQHRGDDPGASR